MRVLMTAAMLAMPVLISASVTAAAQAVPPYKGNDTGGIISYHAYPHEVARDMAFQHCAAYGKTTKITGVQARYGGYVSFACIWRPTVARGAVVSVMY